MRTKFSIVKGSKNKRLMKNKNVFHIKDFECEDSNINFYIPEEDGRLNYFGTLSSIGKDSRSGCKSINIKIDSKNVTIEQMDRLFSENLIPSIIGVEKTKNGKDGCGNPVGINNIYECMIGIYNFDYKDTDMEEKEVYISIIPKSFKKVYGLVNRKSLSFWERERDK